ncbi:hypothetical protein M096_4639 [Parabacteroides distasonis str. 3999B T(B) 6]|nr:hypothetical protein M096_4639 [Parabacteroides distasonis str. 3999B T(B) 6]
MPGRLYHLDDILSRVVALAGSICRMTECSSLNIAIRFDALSATPLV